MIFLIAAVLYVAIAVISFAAGWFYARNSHADKAKKNRDHVFRPSASSFNFDVLVGREASRALLDGRASVAIRQTDPVRLSGGHLKSIVCLSIGGELIETWTVCWPAESGYNTVRAAETNPTDKPAGKGW
jgi:hypothetical protein